MAEKQKPVGAIWKRTMKNGDKEYLSISVEIEGVKHEFVAFPNDYKKEEKHPDFKVYPRQERGASF